MGKDAAMQAVTATFDSAPASPSVGGEWASCRLKATAAYRLTGTQSVNDQHHLCIGGCDTVDLAAQFGTPLVVYDEALMRDTIREFQAAFAQTGFGHRVAYAAKAFCTIAMCQLAAEEGCLLDVVSGGELYTALRAGVPAANVHLHGNNKTPEELAYALEQQVGAVVVDNEDELHLLARMAADRGATVTILLRIAPGVEAHTHEFIATGQQDSKFGFDLASGQALAALALLARYPQLDCIGLHCHIGSQLFDAGGMLAALEPMTALYRAGIAAGVGLRVLNLGGGFGIRYTAADDPLPFSEQIAQVVAAVQRSFRQALLPQPEVWVEPGRAIVGLAGTTLYRAGSRKRIDQVRNYVSVDGGMTDNPRYALYGARYEALLANRADADADAAWTVAGKCCESGDVVAPDVALAAPAPGDLLAVLATGAYNYSMASHYNRIPHPAVVFAQGGEARLVVERETWADVARLDRPLGGA